MCLDGKGGHDILGEEADNDALGSPYLLGDEADHKEGSAAMANLVGRVATSFLKGGQPQCAWRARWLCCTWREGQPRHA